MSLSDDDMNDLDLSTMDTMLLPNEQIDQIDNFSLDLNLSMLDADVADTLPDYRTYSKTSPLARKQWLQAQEAKYGPIKTWDMRVLGSYARDMEIGNRNEKENERSKGFSALLSPIPHCIRPATYKQHCVDIYTPDGSTLSSGALGSGSDSYEEDGERSLEIAFEARQKKAQDLERPKNDDDGASLPPLSSWRREIKHALSKRSADRASSELATDSTGSKSATSKKENSVKRFLHRFSLKKGPSDSPSPVSTAPSSTEVDGADGRSKRTQPNTPRKEQPASRHEPQSNSLSRIPHSMSTGTRHGIGSNRDDSLQREGQRQRHFSFNDLSTSVQAAAQSPSSSTSSTSSSSPQYCDQPRARSQTYSEPEASPRPHGRSRTYTPTRPSTQLQPVPSSSKHPTVVHNPPPHFRPQRLPPMPTEVHDLFAQIDRDNRDVEAYVPLLPSQLPPTPSPSLGENEGQDQEEGGDTVEGEGEDDELQKMNDLRRACAARLDLVAREAAVQAREQIRRERQRGRKREVDSRGSVDEEEVARSAEQDGEQEVEFKEKERIDSQSEARAHEPEALANGGQEEGQQPESKEHNQQQSEISPSLSSSHHPPPTSSNPNSPTPRLTPSPPPPTTARTSPKCNTATNTPSKIPIPSPYPRSPSHSISPPRPTKTPTQHLARTQSRPTTPPKDDAQANRQGTGWVSERVNRIDAMSPSPSPSLIPVPTRSKSSRSRVAERGAVMKKED